MTGCSGRARAVPGPIRPVRIRASWIARINVVVALAVVLLGLGLRG